MTIRDRWMALQEWFSKEKRKLDTDMAAKRAELEAECAKAGHLWVPVLYGNKRCKNCGRLEKG